jgi:dTDP-glucose 4,6-dehydratase
MRKILITGGAGFIGSHVVRLFVNQYPSDVIFNLDKLTYAGNLENLKDVEMAPNYTFLQADITDSDEIEALFEMHGFTHVIHLAAESHVDRSITGPLAFVSTNVLGTVHLLNACRRFWGNSPNHLFHHISTDEVFGSLGPYGAFTEETPYHPRSPYSASKAASDHLVRAYFHTYGLPVVLSNCSNNYGPYQFPEKLIPLAIHHLLEEKPIPVYGKGENIRDWLYVEDHALAIDLIFHKGRLGESYNVGTENEWRNIDLIKLLIQMVDQKLGRPLGSSQRLINFVKDRLGHDERYAIDPKKIQQELGWKPQTSFQEGISKTIDWYLSNSVWLENITTGAYQHYAGV